VWNISEEDDEKTALMGIEETIKFFESIGMPVTLRGLGIGPNDDDLKALAMDATMNDTMKLSRIRPINADLAYQIYKEAL
jgi:alcohol dehydrogenase YqhD (iron-dependent ADH family)